MNKGIKTGIYVTLAGILGYLGYTWYAARVPDGDAKNYVDWSLAPTNVLIDTMMGEVDATIDPTTGGYADGQLDPEIFALPDSMISEREPDLVIDLNSDVVFENYGQSNFDFLGVINPLAGEVIQFTNEYITINIHNVNNFEFWFDITSMYCIDGYAELYSFTINPVTIMSEITQTSYSSNLIGYQFNDIGIANVEVIIACIDQYDNLLEPVSVSFNINVGNFLELGGEIPEDTPYTNEDFFGYQEEDSVGATP